jgi:hypothetical protein
MSQIGDEILRAETYRRPVALRSDYRMLPRVRTLIPLVLVILAVLVIADGDGLVLSMRVASAIVGASVSPAAVYPPGATEEPSLVRSSDAHGVARGTHRLTLSTPESPAVAVAPTAMEAPSVAPAPLATALATPTAVPMAACPVDWFCYPRLGIAGPIVPYGDCYGRSDIGMAIRAYTCLSPRYLMGHAYTQFGAIANWRPGDVVTAYGQAFVVTGAVTARSCEQPPLPLAPLSLQTSLSPNACGPVLIVQAR